MGNPLFQEMGLADLVTVGTLLTIFKGSFRRHNSRQREIDQGLAPPGITENVRQSVQQMPEPDGLRRQIRVVHAI